MLSDLLEFYQTSTALAHQLEISRMSLLNWRERPESIREENLLRIEVEWHQSIWMIRYNANELEQKESSALPTNFSNEIALQSAVVDSLSFGSLEVETGTSERDFRKATQALEIPKNIDAAQYLAIQNIYSATRRILMLNLLKNSLEAITEEMSINRSDDGFIRLTTAAAENDFFTITVEDSGCGTDNSTLEQIFKTGFTTKSEGSGYGLHSAANFVHQLGGEITAKSDGLHQGMKITVLLPISTEENKKAF